MKSYFSPIIASLSLFAMAGLAAQMGFISNEIAAWSYGYIGIFTLIVLLFYKQLTSSKNSKSFITLFLGAVAAKMFITLIYLTIGLYTHKHWAMMDKMQLAISIFIAYIVFTVVLARAKPIQD
ncbi:MAG: hypothetical protein RL521_1230 [Bacteroidota bacterium]|jgi:hypothetical protein